MWAKKRKIQAMKRDRGIDRARKRKRGIERLRKGVVKKMKRVN